MLYGLAIVLIPLFLGYLFIVKNHQIMQIINRIVTICLYLILFVMGISLGQLDDILTKLPKIGRLATGLCLIIIITNIMALTLYDKWQPMPRENFTEQIQSRLHMLLDSLKLVGITFLGGVIGYLGKSYFQISLHASTYVLVVMIFGVGIQLRNSSIPLKQVFFNKRGIQTALVMMSSSLLGGLFASFALNLTAVQGLALSSAFGWYSLSSVLVTDAWGPIYGSIAFFNDLFREMLCLFIIPIFMKNFPSTAIGVGGATSLDCMLPVIQKSGGTQMVPLAISFGFITNLVPPFLLAIFTSL